MQNLIFKKNFKIWNRFYWFVAFSIEISFKVTDNNLWNRKSNIHYIVKKIYLNSIFVFCILCSYLFNISLSFLLVLFQILLILHSLTFKFCVFFIHILFDGLNFLFGFIFSIFGHVFTFIFCLLYDFVCHSFSFQEIFSWLIHFLFIK